MWRDGTNASALEASGATGACSSKAIEDAVSVPNFAYRGSFDMFVKFGSTVVPVYFKNSIKVRFVNTMLVESQSSMPRFDCQSFSFDMSTMAEGVNVEEDIYKKQGRVWERAGSHHGSCISLSTEFMIPTAHRLNRSLEV